jgi:hypothetical protein
LTGLANQKLRRSQFLYPTALVLVSLAILLPLMYVSTESHWDRRAFFSYLIDLFSGHPFDLDYLAANPKAALFTHYPATGRTVSLWGPGTSIMWLPFYSICRLVYPTTPLDAYPFWWACAFASLLYVVAGMVLLFETLRRWFPAWAAFIATLAMLLATPLIFYAAKNSGTSHGPSFFLVALMLWLVATQDWYRLRTWIIFGAVVGFAGMVRTQMIFFAPLCLIAARPNWKQAAYCAAAAFVAFLPQMIFWKATFGRWFVNPQGEIMSHYFHIPAVAHVLFHPYHGAFTWHPLMLVASIGLAALLWKQPRLAAICLFVFAVQVIINASVNWSAAASFGNRRFCDCLPLLAVGLCYLFARYKWTLVFAVPTIAFNFLLILPFHPTISGTWAITDPHLWQGIANFF